MTDEQLLEAINSAVQMAQTSLKAEMSALKNAHMNCHGG